jgi:hypothetical protein|tara:strand:+ start:269 stop:967 length:699 start_codon:yes stop_codon:yes gene_type:complete
MSSSVIFCDASHGAYSATLPDAGVLAPGTILIYKKTDASVNAVTISGASGATIDGEVSIGLAQPYEAVSLATNGANWFVVSASSSLPTFRGARVTISSDYSVPPNTYVYVPWDVADVDTDGFWSASDPTKLTVPSGIKRVRLTFNTMWKDLASGVVNTHTMKNRDLYPGMGQKMELPTVSTEGVVVTYTNVVSAAVEVEEGDYFELRVVQGDSVARDLWKFEETWFEIAAVE